MKKTKSGIDKPILYYIGDLPSHRVDGITTSFSINIKILSEKFTIHQVAENRLIGDRTFSKIWKIGCLLSNVLKQYSRISPAVVYTNFALSFWGLTKTFLVLMLSKWHRSSVVLHLHRGDFDHAFPRKLFCRILAKIIIEKADQIVVLSEKIKERFITDYDPSKFIVLPNTIEEEMHFENVVKPKTNFLFLSNYLETKGIFDLLQSFRELENEYPDIKLFCYGTIPNGKMKKRLETYSSVKIIINASINGHEKFTKIHESCCFILPSWNEGQPLVILEAMSMGVPVITSDTGDVPMMLGENYAYMFEAKNRDDLKRVIRKFLVEKDNDHIGRYLKNRYYQYYSQEKHRKILLKLFDQFSK